MTPDHSELLRMLLHATKWYREAETKAWQERNAATANLKKVIAECEAATNENNDQNQKPN